MHASICVGFSAVLLVLCMPGLGYAQQQLRAGETFIPGEILVKFKRDTAATDIAAVTVQSRVRMLHLPSGTPVYQLTTTLPVLMAVAQYNRLPQVEYAEPNYIVQPSTYARRLPNDALFRHQWGLHNTGQLQGKADADMDAPRAWSIQTGSSGVVVAVLDTGSDLRHPDKVRNLWRNPGEIPDDGIDNDLNGFVDDVFGWDFYHNDATVFDPGDGDEHGTLTSGIIGARGNNSIGMVGMNWNVRIMTLKFIGPDGGTIADAIRALKYATAMGAHVSNNSWGNETFSRILKEAIDASPLLFVTSAGNAGRNTDHFPRYPASYSSSNILAVAATNRWDRRALFSNFGARTIDLGAPGDEIMSTLPLNTYGLAAGTSFAAPHVTGVAALILAQFPHISPEELKGRLLAGIDRLPDLADKTVSGGRLNAMKALTVAMGSIAGTVMDQHQSPVPQAWVALRKHRSNDEARRLLTTRHGTFTFTGLPAGTYLLSARKASAQVARRIDLLQGEHDTVTLVLE